MWMTSSMRADFERFGFLLCIDAMKAAFNKMTWPYLAVTSNEFDTPVVICESILAGERKAAYEAVLQAMLKMAPKRKKQDVYMFLPMNLLLKICYKKQVSLMHDFSTIIIIYDKILKKFYPLY